VIIWTPSPKLKLWTPILYFIAPDLCTNPKGVECEFKMNKDLDSRAIAKAEALDSRAIAKAEALDSRYEVLDSNSVNQILALIY